MNVQRLVEMANDIGAFFRAEPDAQSAANGVLGHMEKFWDPRMRQAIVKHLANGGDGLEEPARSAVQALSDKLKGR